MARKKSTTSIENEINKVKSEMTKLQIKYDNLADKLESLEKEKCQRESELIMEAYHKSNKSIDEIMKFLKP